MSLQSDLSRTLLICRLIEDAIYGDHEWWLKVEDENGWTRAVPEIEVTGSGVTFSIVAPHRCEDADFWLMRDEEDVFHTVVTAHSGDEISINFRVGDGVRQ